MAATISAKKFRLIYNAQAATTREELTVTDSRIADWEEVYFALLALMSHWGRNQDFKGATDYLVVSDDWGGMSQKIEIVNPNLPIDEIGKSIQELLASRFPKWDVIVVFDDGTNRGGLRLFADRVIQESEDPTLGLPP